MKTRGKRMDKILLFEGNRPHGGIGDEYGTEPG